jgi:DNA helicase-2/ATP-dependent DNA helicase PcrA
MEIEKHIPQAEKVFLGEGTFKDDRNERIDFIKNLETCDLLAVPGSGKTTALIAKLYCIAQNMPFEDGSGILVLAHTNNAVDEIEKKLKKHCPQLFEYPNFVGTIQSFVNKFLAIPHFTQKNKSKFRVIDDIEYNDIFRNYFKNQKGPVGYFSNKNPKLFFNARLNINGNGEIFICNNNENKLLEFNIPRTWINNNIVEENSNQIYDFIKNTKIKFFQKGLLHYDDCYFYAKQYLLTNPNSKLILQKRFKYIFIDEMQDLEDYQIKIIDDIFFAENSKTVIQRIGDKNQSIYHIVKENCDWKTRQEFNSKYADLSFQNSLRLNFNVANLVDKFVFERPENYKVVGKLEESMLKPHLIVINRDTTGDQLKNKFEELIKIYNLHLCEKNLKHGFKIVSWVTEKEEDNNEIYLQKLFSNYSKKNHSPKEDYKSLKDYLYYFDKEKKTLESIRKSILNSFTRILDLEEINDENGRRFRKSTLMQFIKNQSEEYYNNFNAKLYSWCFRIVVNKKNEEVYKEIVSFVKSKDFIGLNWHNIENYQPMNILKSDQFLISSDFKLREEPKEGLKEKEEIQIDLASVHAVKGQTHCATMYIESYFHNYELNKKKIKECILGKEHNIQKEKSISQAVQALKMMYVGFSRPTHLLCFVVLEENVKNYLDSLCHTNGGIWEIKNITIS